MSVSREWTEQDSIDLDVEMVLTGARMALQGEACDEAIRRLAEKGKTSFEIAEILRMAPKSVCYRARKLGVSLKRVGSPLITRAECERIIQIPRARITNTKPRITGVPGSGQSWRG